MSKRQIFVSKEVKERKMQNVTVKQQQKFAKPYLKSNHLVRIKRIEDFI